MIYIYQACRPVVEGSELNPGHFPDSGSDRALYVRDIARRLHIIPLKHVDGDIAWVEIQRRVYPLSLDDDAWITCWHEDGSPGDELIMFFNLPDLLPVKFDQLTSLQKYVDESQLDKIGRKAAHLIVVAYVHFRSLPNGTPIPIHKLVEISSVASVVGTDPFAVATAVGSTEIPRPPKIVYQLLNERLNYNSQRTSNLERFAANGTFPSKLINKPIKYRSTNLNFLSSYLQKIITHSDLLLSITSVFQHTD